MAIGRIFRPRQIGGSACPAVRVSDAIQVRKGRVGDEVRTGRSPIWRASPHQQNLSLGSFATGAEARRGGPEARELLSGSAIRVPIKGTPSTLSLLRLLMRAIRLELPQPAEQNRWASRFGLNVSPQAQVRIFMRVAPSQEGLTDQLPNIKDG